MKNKIYFGTEARDKMFAGIEKVAKAVGSTLGPKGKNVVYRRWGQPLVTNDGVSIARSISLEDPVESMGSDLIKQSAEKTNEEAGDGTTTATVLSYELVKAGLGVANPVSFRKELEESALLAFEEIDKLKTKIESDKDLLDIATISLEDKKIAKIIVESIRQSGDNGRIIVQESQGQLIEKENVTGLEFDSGYASPYMVSNEKGEAVLEEVMVLVTDRSFSLNKDIVPVLNSALEKGAKELFIICKKVEAEALQTIILNKTAGKLFTCVVQTSRSKEDLEDIASLVGATAITEDKGIKNILSTHFGTAKKIVCTKNKTLIVKNTLNEFQEKIYLDRVDGLKLKIKEEKNNDELKTRLASLTGSIVLLKVGASTPAEMTYLKLKVDDAVCACLAAIEDGYVTGGGLSLKNVSDVVHNVLNTEGSRIFRDACHVPYDRLLLSSGLSEKEYVKSLDRVIDPTKVEKSCIKNAISMAGMFLTIDSVIVDIEEPVVK